MTDVRHTNGSLSVKCFHDPDELQHLRNEWNTLASASGNPMLSFEWIDSCLRKLHPDARLNVLVVETQQGAICAIAPLVQVQRDHTIWLDAPGFNDLHEPVELIYQDKASLATLFDAIARLPYPVSLNRLWLNTSHDLPVSPLAVDSHGIWVSPGCRPSRYLDIQTYFDAFMASLSSRHRYDYNRALRRASKVGEIHHVVEKPDRDTLEAHLALAMRIEEKSWKGHGGSSLSKNSRLAAFFRTYLSHPDVLPDVRIFFLHLGEHVAAMQICIEYGGKLWLLKIGYDEAFQKCSPGLLLMMDVVRYSFESGHSGVEFLGSSEPWLSLWSKKEREYFNLTHYPFSLAGARAGATDSTRVFLRRLSRWVTSVKGSPTT